MDTSEYTKQIGTFLKAADVSKNSQWVIVGEGAFVESKKFGNMRLHIPVAGGEEARIFDCSKTNARLIEESLGKETKAWAGNKLWLEIYKTKTSEGKMTEAINIKKVN